VTYFVADSPLCSTELCVDLGVKIDSSLSFNSHINSIVTKAKLRANHIIRCFLSKDCCILTKAFTTSMSSSLKITNRSFRYASPSLWNNLPASFRQPQAHSSSETNITPSITSSLFHSRLKTHLFHKSFPP